PDDVSPVCTVPQTADAESHQNIDGPFRERDAAATHGEIDIVSKPGGKGDVPSAPEFRDTASMVGGIKILHQFKAHQASRADGNVRVSREITVDLVGKKNGREGQ